MARLERIASDSARRWGTMTSDADRARALATTRRFVTEASGDHPHPMFGEMSRADWQRWGWPHLDHHLRQFGL